MTVPFDITRLHDAYREGLTPQAMLDLVFERIAKVDDPGIFIEVAESGALEHKIEGLGPFDPKEKPLWGVPFAIKDNIDVAGFATTAGCPAFAYRPDCDAEVVRQLLEAGAIAIGKTNLDQFATGLVGTRTPYPVPRNALDPALVPGGSSSGSAVAVAHGIVSFALGTDTAGSGRVPAALNNVVGLKPSLGWLSTRGVVPACRTLDCVSVFALTVDYAATIAAIAGDYDLEDPFSRRREPVTMVPSSLTIGVPDSDQLDGIGDNATKESFDAALEKLVNLNCTIETIDFSPFREVAALLYQGAWLAERHIAIADLLSHSPDAFHPITRRIIEPGGTKTAAEAFADRYRLAELRRQVEKIWASIDLIVVPTIPSPVTLVEDAADPIGPNSWLGTYTNFVNLLDLCAVAAPAALVSGSRAVGVTLIAPGGRDAIISSLAKRFQALSGLPLGATGWPVPKAAAMLSAPAGRHAQVDAVQLFVVGAHLTGEPLNHQLVDVGATLVGEAATAPVYRLFDLPGGAARRPGMLRGGDGAEIAGEIWSVPTSTLGSFVAAVAPPLCIGTVELADGRLIKGFLAEADGVAEASEITSYGGWRAYLASLKSS